MRSRNDYKIILNKAKTKPKIFFFLTLNQALGSIAVGIAVYKGLELFLSELFALIIGTGTAVTVASLFIEIPADHLNILQHLKLAYCYYFTVSHQYYYYRTEETEYEEEKEPDNTEIYETRYKVEKKKKKKKRKLVK